MLSWIDCNVEATVNEVFLSCGVSKPNVLELDFANNLFRVEANLCIFGVDLNCVDFRGVVLDSEDSLCSSCSFTHVWSKCCCHAHVLGTEHNCEKCSEHISRIDVENCFAVNNLNVILNDFASRPEHNCKHSVLREL